MNFFDISIVFIIAFIFGYIVNLLKQPPLIGYILTGILLGPLFFNKINDVAIFENLAHLGIAFLLYIVGLHLNENEIKEVGIKPILIGILQVILSFLVGFLVLINFFNLITSIILSFALSLSSTIIIIKIITDKDELDELYSKILVSILIIQDIFAALFLILLDSLNKNTNISASIGLLVMKTIFLIIVLRFIVKNIINKIFDKIAQNQELIFLFSICWCFGIAAFFQYFGLSLEIGSLIAGVLLASSPYQVEISSRIKPLRDFFLVLFFLLLGIKIKDISLSEVVILEVLMLIVLILKPLITYIIMNFFNYSKQINFLSSISLTQVSSFSLIILILAEKRGIIDNKIISLFTITTVFTIAISSYLIKYNHKIYFFLVRRGLIKNHFNNNQNNLDRTKAPQIIIFGYDRIGFSLFKAIKKMSKSYLIIDYNPEIINKLRNRSINCLYGDVSDLNLLEEINFSKTEIAISTIPNLEINTLIIKHLRKKKRSSIIIVTSHKINEALELYRRGADYVILPHFLGGEYVATLLENHHKNMNEILKEKIKHLNELHRRKIEGLEHPEYQK